MRALVVLLLLLTVCALSLVPNVRPPVPKSSDRHDFRIDPV
jgi:hypothetical protein